MINDFGTKINEGNSFKNFLCHRTPKEWANGIII